MVSLASVDAVVKAVKAHGFILGPAGDRWRRRCAAIIDAVGRRESQREHGGRRRRSAVIAQVFTALTFRQMVIGVFLLALLVSGLFDGWRRISPPGPARISAGKAFSAPPFSVTVKRVRYASDLGVKTVPKIDGRYLIVLADVSTSEKQSVPSSVMLDGLVRLKGVPGLQDAKGNVTNDSVTVSPQLTLVAADAQPMGDLGPGLTYELAFFFPQAAGEAVPSTVTVESFAHTWRRSSIDQTWGWFDVTPACVGSFVPTAMGRA